MLVAAGLDYEVRHGLVDLTLAHASDVGVSYGLVAVAGALTWLLVPRRWRPVWVLAVFLSIAVAALGGLTFTDVGHLLSLAIGLATAPLVWRWQRTPGRAVLAGEPISVPPLAWRRLFRRLRTRGSSAPSPAATTPALEGTPRSTP